MAVVIKDTITPAGRKFFKELAELRKLECRVGLLSGEMAEIAGYNELGTTHIPPRPFLRQTADNRRAEINAICGAALRQVTQGGSAQKATNTVGVGVVALVQDEMTTGGFVENKPSTIAQKGSAQPLIDTGQMRQSVEYVVHGR